MVSRCDRPSVFLEPGAGRILWFREAALAWASQFGNIGWCPLAPFEGFHPWWGRGFYGGYRNGIFNRNTIVNNTNIYNTYRNARVANGVTAMSAQNFGRTATVGNMTRVSANELHSASLVRGQAPVAPNRASLNFSNRQVNAQAFPQTQNRQFFNHTQPAQVNRVPFQQQQRGMEQAAQRVAGQPASGSAVRSGAMARGMENTGAARVGGAQPNAAVHSNAPSGGAANGRVAAPNTSSNNGWRRFEGPSATSNGSSGAARQAGAAPREGNPASSSARPAQSGNGGWQRFGGVPNQPSRSVGTSRGAETNRGWSAPRAPRESAPRTQSSPSRGWGSNEPVRINPRIVQDRPAQGSQYRAPSYRAPSNNAPTYHAPSYSAPSYRAPSAPAYHPNSGGGGSRPSYSGGGRPSGGGGGGGSRPSGSGGGGARPSGGGGGGHPSGGGGGHHGR